MKKYLSLQIQFTWLLLIYISLCYHESFFNFGWKEVDALPLTDKNVILRHSRFNSKSQYHCRSIVPLSAFTPNKSYSNNGILMMMIKRFLPGTSFHTEEITPLLSISTKWRNRRSSMLHDRIGETLETTNSETKEDQPEYIVRQAKYGDLKSVAKILVKAFYDTTPLLKNFHLLKELDRLQSNFPYSDPNHFMYVAISKSDGQVLGFVDIDFRETRQRNAPPRPYLSDLAVHEKWRRKGIARNLIFQCEEKAMELEQQTLYLRVESKNEKALKMYFSLGYDYQPSEIFGVLDTTMLLKRHLKNRFDQENENIDKVQSTVSAPLNYIV